MQAILCPFFRLLVHNRLGTLDFRMNHDSLPFVLWLLRFVSEQGHLQGCFPVIITRLYVLQMTVMYFYFRFVLFLLIKNSCGYQALYFVRGHGYSILVDWCSPCRGCLGHC